MCYFVFRQFRVSFEKYQRSFPYFDKNKLLIWLNFWLKFYLFKLVFKKISTCIQPYLLMVMESDLILRKPHSLKLNGSTNRIYVEKPIYTFLKVILKLFQMFENWEYFLGEM